jgi:excisionase family DNA binding protein
VNTVELTLATAGERIAYKPADAAKAIGISPATLYVLMARGDLPAFKLGKRTLIKAADLQAFVDRAPRAQFTSVHAAQAA